MATYRTPGVYVEEISLFPPSVAEVKTAVPAFIGYTEKATQRGRDLKLEPTKIRSLLEFRDRFGGEFVFGKMEVKVNEKNNHGVVGRVVAEKRFYMFEALRLFFDNGGGECYIISVGDYTGTIKADDFTKGLAKLKKQDEPTMILFPDAVRLEDDDQFASLQQAALAQCSALQDRVAVLDLRENAKPDGKLREYDKKQNEAERELVKSVESFRNKVGINHLKYGATYTPWLFSAYDKDVEFEVFRDGVKDSSGTKVELDQFSPDPKLNDLVARTNVTIKDRTTLVDKLKPFRTAGAKEFPTLADRLAALKKDLRASTDDATATVAFAALMVWLRSVARAPPDWIPAFDGDNLVRDLKAYAKDRLRKAVEGLIALEKQKHVGTLTGDNNTAVTGAYAVYDTKVPDWLSKKAADITKLPDNAFADAKRDSALKMADAAAAHFEELNAFLDSIAAAAKTHKDLAQPTMYQGHPVISGIVEHIEREMKRVPPSGAIVGVYSMVDRMRGVWKAPANVSLSAVAEPAEPIDYFDQEDLNIDVNGGKSINAIRTFAGKGTLVWGARTLAGNDNEWRYVPVRRFFNMVEESVKKSTGWAVFEPNDAKLWVKVKGMIDNYLVQKWREGALQGAVPDDAFFVKVGLGETMIAQDILEGRLIIEIGMAVVRPAEFIILKFMHKMPVS